MEVVIVIGAVALAIVAVKAMIGTHEHIDGVNEPKVRGTYHVKKGRK